MLHGGADPRPCRFSYAAQLLVIDLLDIFRRNPTERPVRRPNRQPSGRLLTIDFNLLSACQAIRRIKSVTGPGNNFGLVRYDISLIGKLIRQHLRRGTDSYSYQQQLKRLHTNLPPAQKSNLAKDLY